MPWLDNVAWDDAIEASDRIAIGTALPDPEATGDSTEVLHRPGELLVDTKVWEDPDHPIRRRLDDNGVRSLGEEPRDGRDRVRAQTADDLGLRLLLIEGRNPIGLVAESRASDQDAEGLSIVHVGTVTPQRHGGCAPPQLVEPSLAIPDPGRSGGAGVRIAVLDTGIADPAPADIDLEVRGPVDVEVLDAPRPGPYGPAVGHGTMVAGVIATYAPDATLVIRRVFETPLGEADELEIAAALDALPDDLNIINASFGGFAVDNRRMLALEAAVRRLPQDVVIVASVGNEGVDRPVYIAEFERVVSVASAEAADDGSLQLAPYSNRGKYVKLCAHGTDVESTFITQHAIGSGTSFAAPKVTAAVARGIATHGSARNAADALINDGSRPQIPRGGRFVDP